MVVPAQSSKASRAVVGSAAHGPSRPDGLSPAAQALAPKKPSAFLQLFRKIAGAGRKAPPAEARRTGMAAEAPAGQEAARGKSRISPPQPGAEVGEARAGRRPRRGKPQPDASLEAVGFAAPAPARRPRGTAPQEAAVPAVEARQAPRPAQARVFVIDLRARAAAGGERPGVRSEAAAPEREQTPGSFQRAMLAREPGNGAPAAASLPEFLSGQPTSSSGFTAASSPASMPGFAAVKERLLPEIVRQAGIVLRDGGEGEIRLVLKPEHLGSVRIRLQLRESSLEGRIVVDNSNVKELLDAHLEQLKSALRQEGYASANIDVTVSGGGGERRDLSPDPAPPAVSGRTAGQFERATPAVLDLGFTTVNLLA